MFSYMCKRKKVGLWLKINQILQRKIKLYANNSLQHIYLQNLKKIDILLLERTLTYNNNTVITITNSGSSWSNNKYQIQSKESAFITLFTLDLASQFVATFPKDFAEYNLLYCQIAPTTIHSL